MTFVRVSYQNLYNYLLETLKNVGVPENDAKIITDSLTQADLRGVNTHGIYHLPKYIARIKAGSLKAVTNITIVSETSSVTLLDGGGGFGHVAGHKAMQMAIKKSKENGISLSLVKNSNQFGAAAYFSMLALEEDQIGFATTNASPTIAPTGSISPLLGTNPISIAVPAGKYCAPVLDFALSVSNLSKIKKAAEQGLEIPLGLATNSEGEETSNAQDAVKGLLIPIGGYKGYGLSFMVDVLCGVLSGASFGPFVGKHIQDPNKKAKPQNEGHAFLAINIEKFMNISVFKSRIDKYIKIIKSSQKLKGVEEIYYPGEKESRTKIEQTRKGIKLEKVLIDDLIKVGKEYGLDVSLKVEPI